jgi:hypothetical protein
MGEAGSISTGNKKKGGLISGDSNYSGGIRNIESLIGIKNMQTYKDLKAAISRYHAVLGVRQQKVKLADLKQGVGGVHRSTIHGSEGVYLSKQVFKNGTRKSISSWVASGYKSGHLTKTNKPVAHIVTHELAHATWNNHLTSRNALNARRSINTLYVKWKGSRKKKGYGTYAKSNVNEFWAELSTKAVHGKQDKYTRKLKQIVRRYKL